MNLSNPAAAIACSVSAISFDGTVAAGACDTFPVTWKGTAPSIFGLTIGTSSATLAGANLDGTILTGTLVASDGFTQHSGLWTSTTPTLLTELGPSTGSNAVGMSSDGSFIVGNVFLSSSAAGLGQAYRWTRATGVMGLVPLIPGTPAFSQAVGVSANGDKVIFIAKGFGTAVWTASTNALALLPTTFSPRAISGDGTTVVGNDPNVPALWTGGTTSTDLTARITSLGVNLGGFVLNEVTAVSNNGKVLVGSGSSSTGVGQGWVIVLP